MIASIATWAFAGAPIANPPIDIGADGFPSGGATPEGAACDFARAFIRDDSALLLATCVEPYGSPEARQSYHDFLKSIVVEMKLPIPASGPAPESPTHIVRCFAARPLSKQDPVALATLGFADIRFVDVSSMLRNGTTQLCRTLVLRTRQGKWLVDPQPEANPVLSEGLDDESPSEKVFTDAYAVPTVPP